MVPILRRALVIVCANVSCPSASLQMLLNKNVVSWGAVKQSVPTSADFCLTNGDLTSASMLLMMGCILWHPGELGGWLLQVGQLC